MGLSKAQQEYGQKIISDFAARHNITYDMAVIILYDITNICFLWKWVNMDQFLLLNLKDK